MFHSQFYAVKDSMRYFCRKVEKRIRRQKVAMKQKTICDLRRWKARREESEIDMHPVKNSERLNLKGYLEIEMNNNGRERWSSKCHNSHNYIKITWFVRPEIRHKEEERNRMRKRGWYAEGRCNRQNNSMTDEKRLSLIRSRSLEQNCFDYYSLFHKSVYLWSKDKEFPRRKLQFVAYILSNCIFHW